MSGMHLCGIGAPSSHGPSQSPAPYFHLERVAAVDVSSSIIITCHLMGEVGSQAGPAEGAAIYASRVGTA
jgi:hypothetical protein